MKNIHTPEIFGDIGRISSEKLEERENDFREIEQHITTLKKNYANLGNEMRAMEEEQGQLTKMSDALWQGIDNGTESYSIDFIRRTRDVVDRVMASGERMAAVEKEIGVIIEDIRTLLEIQNHLEIGQQLGKT